MDAGEEFWFSDVDSGEVSQGDWLGYDFWINFQDKVPSSLETLLSVHGSVASTDDWNLRIDTDSDLEVYDSTQTLLGTVTDPFTVDDWHRIQIQYQQLASGAFKMWVDKQLVVDETGKDLAGSADWPTGAWYLNNRGIQFTWDGFYHLSGGSGNLSDFIDDPDFLGPFQNTAEDATDQGTPLDTGAWNDTGEMPFNDSNVGIYTGGSAKAGHTRFDEGARLGPGAFPGTVYAYKGIFRSRKPATVAATVHNHRLGSLSPPSTENYTDYPHTPNTSISTTRIVRSSQDAPADGDYLLMGMTIDAGGEGFEVGEVCGFILTDAVVAVEGMLGGVGRGVGRGVMEGVG